VAVVVLQTKGEIMQRLLVPLLAVILLVGCGGAPAVTAQQVSQALASAGATNIHDEAVADSVPVPKSFTAHQAFEIASVAPKGGQYFICDSKKNCDAIYAYFDSLKALAGPYLYQSPSGTVVVQLNSGLKPDDAAKYEQAVTSLP
jgi:hypothetical protein